LKTVGASTRWADVSFLAGLAGLAATSGNSAAEKVAVGEQRP
jgi:hypothetical protein